MRAEALILCGGASSRWGGQPKSLQAIAGQPMLAHALAALAPLALERLSLAVGAWGELHQGFGLPMIPDEGEGPEGPLAALVAAWSSLEAELLWLWPCDAVAWPAGATEGMRAAVAGGAPLAYLEAEGRAQPTCALLRPAALPNPRQAWAQGVRSLWAWERSVGGQAVAVEGPWWNLNRAEVARAWEQSHG